MPIVAMNVQMTFAGKKEIVRESLCNVDMPKVLAENKRSINWVK